MYSIRSALFLFGILVSVIGIGMFFPCIIDAANGEDTWIAFLCASVTTLFVGGFLVAATIRKEHVQFSYKDFIITLSLFWFVSPIFASLPLLYSTYPFNFMDCYFEAVSSITSTGSSVIYDALGVPHGLIIWRALAQIIGASVFIVSSCSIFGLLYCIYTNKNGTVEVTEPEFSDRIILNNIKRIFILLIAFAFASAIIVSVILDIDIFRSFYISSSLLTTSGVCFPEMVGSLNSKAMYTYTALALLSGLPIFSIFSTKRFSIRSLMLDKQIYAYFILIATCFVIRLIDLGYELLPLHSIKEALFEAVSSVTTNSIASYDDYHISPFLFLIKFIGGCTGSASGGFKVFRILAIIYIVQQCVIKTAEYNSSRIGKRTKICFSNDVCASVATYCFMFCIVLLITSYFLSLNGIVFSDAVSYAYTALTNNSVATPTHPLVSSNIIAMSDSSKFIICNAMIFGRMEILPLMAILSIRFWKNQ